MEMASRIPLILGCFAQRSLKDAPRRSDAPDGGNPRHHLRPDAACRYRGHRVVGQRMVGLPLGFAVLSVIGTGAFVPPGENFARAAAAALFGVGSAGGQSRHPGRAGDPDDDRDRRQFGIATAVGILLAVAITFSAAVREALYPNIVMFQVIPKIALAPLFIVWLGVGSRSCIVVGVFIAFSRSSSRPRPASSAPSPTSCNCADPSRHRNGRCSASRVFPIDAACMARGMKVGVTWR